MEHFYENIQGWMNFACLYKNIVQEAPDGALFVEVGSWKGRSAAYLAVEIVNSGKNIRVCCVDHWRGSVEHKNVPADLFDQFLANTKPVAAVIAPVRLESVLAAERFAPSECYFVFIDAGHSCDEVRADIQAWFPKVRDGGIIAGDDYLKPDVRKAVLELLPQAKVSGGVFWPYWWFRVPKRSDP